MLVSTNRTIVHFVAAHPTASAEPADPGLDFPLQCLKPGELIHPSGQLLKVGDDQCADRGVTLRGGDPGIAVDVIGESAAETFTQVNADIYANVSRTGSLSPAWAGCSATSG
jgi:hypothetical protein